MHRKKLVADFFYKLRQIFICLRNYIKSCKPLPMLYSKRIFLYLRIQSLSRVSGWCDILYAFDEKY